MNRIAEFQKTLIADAAVIENPVNLLYLTGLNVSRGTLALTRHESAFFVDGRYFAKAQRESPCPVRLLEGAAVFEWLQGRGVQVLEFDSASTSYDRYEALKTALPEVRLSPRSSPVKGQRAIKDPEEIAALRKAADLTMRGIQHAKTLLKEGITEEEIAFQFEVFVRKHGASGLSFDTIVAFGENTAYPHYRAGKAKLEKDQAVLIDVGAVVDSYHGDLTRVFFFGKPDPILEKWLEWAREAQEKAMEVAYDGAKVADLDRSARKVFARHGVEELFAHSLGHGVGLETHEFPLIRESGADQGAHLRTGMVITIEPGLYKPGLGGVRLEDMILITDKGCERISTDR